MSARRKPIVESQPNGGTTISASSTTTKPSGIDTMSQSPASFSPLLPTRLETLLLSLYPLTLLLGSLFSLLSDTTRNTPYSYLSQSHPSEVAPSYFAQKKNIFNVYFVKVGWFWTTLAFTIFLFTHSSFGTPLYPTLTTRRLRGIARYALITTYWVFVTQWFFGPPLIDRGFRFTGGQCELLRDPEAREDMSDARKVATHAACKAVGGSWKGGHDISGHVFLLILGSALLWFEILPALTHAEGLRDGRRVLMSDGKIRSVAVEAAEEAKAEAKRRGENPMTTNEKKAMSAGTKFALGVVALMWWMLLMTAAFFHTWFEKFTGLLVAFGVLWTVYFLPRGLPQLRSIVGMPGV